MTALRQSLELAGEQLAKAHRLVYKGQHSEALALGSKELRVARATNRSTLEALRLFPGSSYNISAYEWLGTAQDCIKSFHDGNGWNCLRDAVERIDTVLELIAEHSKV